MKKKVLYTCEICHTDYADEAEAKKCEKEHAKAIGVDDIRVHAHSKYPHKVLVRFNDKSLWYRM